MKTKITLILLVLFSLPLKASTYIDYYNTTNEAYYWFYLKKYPKANACFEKAMKLVSQPKSNDCYNYARSLWEVGDIQLSKAYLEKSLTPFLVGYFEKRDSTYFKGMSSKYKAKIILQYKQSTNFQLAEKQEDFLKHFYDSIIEKDYTLRQLITDSIEPYYRYRASDTIYPTYMHKLRIQDSLNGIALLKFAAINPWVCYENQFSPIFNHQTTAWFEQNYATLFKLLEDGRLDSYMFARSFERCANLSLFNTFEPDCKLSPLVIFQNKRGIGLSPYFINTWFLFAKDNLPQKTKEYDYFSIRKTTFYLAE